MSRISAAFSWISTSSSWINTRVRRWPIWETLGFVQAPLVIISLGLGIGLAFGDYFKLRQRAADERTEKHLRAWQVIQTGEAYASRLDGRIEAMETLVADGVSLDGLGGELFYLVGADLRGASLRDANLNLADLRCADLRDANLTLAFLPPDPFRHRGVNIAGAQGLDIGQRSALLKAGAVEIPGSRNWQSFRDSLMSQSDFWENHR